MTAGLRQVIRQVYPEAYHVLGVGYCGPNWEGAQAMETAVIKAYHTMQAADEHFSALLTATYGKQAGAR